MAGIYSQGGSAGHRYAGWLETVEAKNFQFGGKVFNGSPSAIYVGSKMVWPSGWLTFAAVQAILGAFGQTDGMAVINATNAYLSQLAASGQAGKDKATALADVLNANSQNAVMAKYVADYGDSFAHMVLDLGMTKFYTPRLAIDADDTKDERKWLIRSAYGYTDWANIDNVMSQSDWAYVLGGVTPTNNYVSKVGNTAYTVGTLVKFFVPTTMPIGWSEWFADNIDVRVNGTQILSTGSYHNNRKDVAYDFSNIIQLNKPNYMIIKWYGGGNHGVDFGLRG